MRFTLQIELGNDAMQTVVDISQALREVARDLDGGAHSGAIRDENGNSVGSFEIDWTED